MMSIVLDLTPAEEEALLREAGALEKPEYRITDGDWDALTKGIEDSPPGQRSVFSEGTNPFARRTA